MDGGLCIACALVRLLQSDCIISYFFLRSILEFLGSTFFLSANLALICCAVMLRSRELLDPFVELLDIERVMLSGVGDGVAVGGVGEAPLELSSSSTE